MDLSFLREFLREDELSQFEIMFLEEESEEEESEEEEDKAFKEFICQTFTIKCKKRLSPQAKTLLLCWNGKPFYSANEDVLYLFKSNRIEQDFLLKTLHSMAIFLQNVTCTRFSDILICGVKITPAKIGNNSSKEEFAESITFKLKCRFELPPEEPEELLW